MNEKHINPMNEKHTLKSKIHILCNGEVLEYTYFCDFRDHIALARTIRVERKGFGGLAPWKLIEKAVAYRKSIEDFEDDDQIWCVFDVDNFLNDNPEEYNKAIAEAKNNGIKLAWSNECFELWLLLHFQVVSGEIPRKGYHKKLASAFRTQHLGVYQKNGDKMFENTFNFVDAAIKNANNLPQPNVVTNNHSTNPSTGMVPLIETLQGFLR